MLREASCEIVSNDVSYDRQTVMASGFCFGPFVLIPQRQMLLRNGEQVRIGGRALEILTLLVERAGELLCKQEIIARVWAGIFVDESNLKVNIAAIRKAIDDVGTHWSCIATIVGRGYRFVAPVRHVSTGEADLSEVHSDQHVSAVRLAPRDRRILPAAVRPDVHPFVSMADVAGSAKTSAGRVVWIRVFRQRVDRIHRSSHRSAKRLHRKRSRSGAR